MTTHPDAVRWNERFRQEEAAWLARRPRRLLVEHAHLLPPGGLALEAAAGTAASGLFLAERGLHVIALDIAEVGLRLARRRAAERGLRLETAVLDLARPWLPEQRFDVILNFRFLERATFPVYQRALKPGGLLYFETFVAASDAIPHPAYYLRPGELQRAFADFELLHWQQIEHEALDGRSPRLTEQLVARKPAPS